MRDIWARPIITDPPLVGHHLVCWNCNAEYRGLVNACPHCQDGYMH